MTNRQKKSRTKTESMEDVRKWFQNRLLKFDTVTSSLDVLVNGEKLCVKSSKLGNAVKMNKRFGSPSIFGEAWLGYTFKNKYNVAIKKMPLGEDDQYESYTYEQLMSGDSCWSEMTAYMLCTILVMSNVCPNLPVLYKYFWCPSCKFVNKAIKGKATRPCLLVVNELANGDLKMYLEKKPEIWTPGLVDSCVFQIAAGLYALEKYYGMTHNDLHYGNILVHEIPAGGYWHYKIHGKHYYVPNLGYLFLLWDFGMTNIPGKIKGRPEFYTVDASPIPNETDIGRICAVMADPLRSRKVKNMKGKQHEILGKIIKNEHRQQPVREIIEEYFTHFKKKVSNEKIIDNYNMDLTRKQLKNAHPKELARFLK